MLWPATREGTQGNVWCIAGPTATCPPPTPFPSHLSAQATREDLEKRLKCRDYLRVALLADLGDGAHPGMDGIPGVQG